MKGGTTFSSQTLVLVSFLPDFSLKLEMIPWPVRVGSSAARLLIKHSAGNVQSESIEHIRQRHVIMQMRDTLHSAQSKRIFINMVLVSIVLVVYRRIVRDAHREE